VNNEIGRKRTLAVFCFNSSFRHLQGETEETYETLLSRQPISGPRTNAGAGEAYQQKPYIQPIIVRYYENNTSYKGNGKIFEFLKTNTK
jgi:hypothetical protein